jgi:hypothetical protein
MEPTAAYGNHMVTGTFSNRADADRAWQVLTDHGFSSSDIHLIMSDETRGRHYAGTTVTTETDTKTMAGAGTGSAIGITVGAIAAAIAAVGTNLILPGLGLVVAGPLAAALAGAGAGGVTGGLIGALVGSGIPEEHAAVYEREIKNGSIMLGVHTHSATEAASVATELRLCNAQHVHTA